MRKKKDPIYDEISTIANKIKKKVSLAKIDPRIDSVDDRFLKIYDQLLLSWQKFSLALKKKSVKELLVNKNIKLYTPQWLGMLEKIMMSCSQRAKVSAGAAVEDIIRYFLDERNISYSKTKHIDIFLKPLATKERLKFQSGIKISCKHSMRDRVNDRDHDVQIMFFSEVSKKEYLHFAEHNIVVIIIDPTSRQRAIDKIKSIDLELPVYSLSDGLDVIETLRTLKRERNESDETV